MAYNLPPPWDSGYALPDNVRDEGLERRGFVTKQLPRGTYDDPAVGTGGYAVPQYVLDEGYGQGTFTTKMEPRGEYDGPAIPPMLNFRTKLLSDRRMRGGARAITMAAPILVQPTTDAGSAVAMSGTDQLFATYGSKAADVVLAQVARIPRTQREAAIKQILGTIDPTLWPRTKALAQQYARQGASLGAALRAALAQNMASGAVKEAVKLGSSRTAPQTNSLLGLGCYRAQVALGADFASGGVSTKLASQLASGPTASITSTALVRCSGFSWSGSYWERLSSKVDPWSGNPGPANSCPTTSQGTGTTVTANVLSVGPGLEFPLNTARNSMVLMKDPAQIAAIPGLAEWIRKAWTTETKGGGFVAWTPGANPYIDAWISAVGIQPGTKIDTRKIYNFLPAASYRVANPADSNKEWAVTIGLSAPDGTNPIRLNDAANPTSPRALRFALIRPVAEGMLSGVLSTVAKVAAPVVAAERVVIGAAIDLIGDLACQLVQNPNAVSAGGAAGGPAGAAGMALAQQTICQPDAVPMAPPVIAQSGSNLPLWLLLGGGAIVAVVALSKKAS